MNNDYKIYISSIDTLKIDLNIAKKNNSILPLDIQNRNAKILEQIEKDIDLLISSNKTEKDNFYIKEMLDKLIESINNMINILEIICQKNINVLDSSLNKYIVSEIDQLTNIIEYTNKIKDIDFNSIKNTTKIVNYCDFIINNIFKTKLTIDKILSFEKNIYDIENQDINKLVEIVKGILNDKLDYLNSLYEKISYLVFDNNDIGPIYNEYKKYGKRIIKLLNDYNDVNSIRLANKIKYGAVFSVFNIDKNNTCEENSIKEIENNKTQRIKDTEKYKNDYSMLNKSFWEARYKVFDEKIKYPSVLFEKKVKEYQNDYLINKYNRSLEEIENSIDEYRKKYSKEIYMDEIYEEAINQLKDETLLTIDEICDESTELSQLDKRAYIILNDRLMDVIRQIGYVKSDDNLDDFIDITEYKKNWKLNELLDKKEMIEYNMNLIIKKRDEIEKNN